MEHAAHATATAALDEARSAREETAALAHIIDGLIALLEENGIDTTPVREQMRVEHPPQPPPAQGDVPECADSKPYLPLRAAHSAPRDVRLSALEEDAEEESGTRAIALSAQGVSVHDRMFV